MVSNGLYFHLYLGKIPILTNIFQMGGSTTSQFSMDISSVKCENIGFSITGHFSYPGNGLGPVADEGCAMPVKNDPRSGEWHLCLMKFWHLDVDVELLF